jgi:hypothetical protein
MKKIIVILFCVTAAAILYTSVKGQSLGDRIKRAACEKACERSYRNCMEKSGKAVDKEDEDSYASDVKDAAKEESCAYTRERCLEKCNQ